MGQQVYAKGSWKCPGCGMTHKKPHYSLPGQIDYDKRPDTKGRVVFNRRDKSNNLNKDTLVKYDQPSMGDKFDEEGYQRPLYCPHCGWEDEWHILTRTGAIDLVDSFLKDRTKGPTTFRKLLNDFEGFIRGLRG